MTAARRPQAGLLLPEKRGLNRIEAAWHIGFSPSYFDKMVQDGLMPSPKRVGTRRVWDRFALDLAFDALPGEDSSPEINEWD